MSVAVDHRDGRAPVALAADAPVLQAVGDGGCAEAVALGEGRHLVLRFEAGFAGPLAGVDEHSFVFAGVRQRRGRPVSTSGAMTRWMGRPYLVANSKSRSSWAGTLMMAPVP